MYKNSVPYPNGQVAAEELFHLGIFFIEQLLAVILTFFFLFQV